jgi:hypothetical protein
LAQLSPVFANAAILREICGLPVIGSISHGFPHLKRRGLAVAGFAAAIACLTVVFGAAVMVELVGPGIRSLVGLA